MARAGIPVMGQQTLIGEDYGTCLAQFNTDYHFGEVLSCFEEQWRCLWPNEALFLFVEYPLASKLECSNR